MSAWPHVGAWVNPELSPGLWRVYRVEAGFYELRFDPAEPKTRSERQLVFAQRLADSRGRERPETGMWDSSLLRPLEATEDARLRELLSDPAVVARFERYPPEPVDLVVNLASAADDPQEVSPAVDERIGGRIARGMTMDDVLAALVGTPADQTVELMPQWTVIQLVSPDHLRHEDEFVFKSYSVFEA